MRFWRWLLCQWNLHDNKIWSSEPRSNVKLGMYGYNYACVRCGRKSVGVKA